MDPPAALKKPKLEKDTDGDGAADPEQEEILIALVNHRRSEVDTLRKKVALFQSQLDDAERSLSDAQAKLARLRSSSSSSSAFSLRVASNGGGGGVNNAASSSSNSCEIADEVGFRNPVDKASRPQLVIPSLNPKPPMPVIRRHVNTEIDRQKPPAGMTGKPAPSSSSGRLNVLEKPKSEPDEEPKGIRNKRKFEEKEHQDLIPSIRRSSSRSLVKFQQGTHFSSQHKRKLRSLLLCPVNDLMLATSALDGLVNLWQVQPKGPSANLLSTTDCVSPKQRRWPEDLAWHPDGDSLFAAYSADSDDSQVAVLNLNVSSQKRVTFLQSKPHMKGIINSIIFMPWNDICFATGGSDHAVILWHEKDGSWKPTKLHVSNHSSAVMGVAGLQQKKVILSAGADKRVVGFDVVSGRCEFKHQIDSKCMSVLPNPCDFNLFMLQSATPKKQLRLFDTRLRQTEIHSFGWKQESSESQSALINQAWSPDGWYLSSGSADPTIHIFDIRYIGDGPAQSLQAHQKRVFKAIWHKSHPLLTSISSDLNIGLHKVA